MYRTVRHVGRPDGQGTLPSPGVAAVVWVDGELFRTRVLGQEVWHLDEWWFCPMLTDGTVPWPAELLEQFGVVCWCLGSGPGLDGRACGQPGCRAGAFQRAKQRQQGQ